VKFVDILFLFTQSGHPSKRRKKERKKERKMPAGMLAFPVLADKPSSIQEKKERKMPAGMLAFPVLANDFYQTLF
jgi:hypothetical protein